MLRYAAIGIDLEFGTNTDISQWQAAYDKLGEYVWNEEPTTLSYYFGIPYDNEHDFESTPLMFAFEVYDERKVCTPASLSCA